MEDSGEPSQEHSVKKRLSCLSCIVSGLGDKGSVRERIGQKSQFYWSLQS